MQCKSPRISPRVALFKGKELPKNMRIVELGCRDRGILLGVAAALNTTDLYGVDIDGWSLNKAAQKGINVHKLDLNTDHLPFPDEFFDIALMEEVIEHLINPDNSLQEAYRVLQFGGYFLITTPNLAWWFNRLTLLLGYQPYWTECSVRYNVGKFRTTALEVPMNGHLRLFTSRALKQLLQLYGFKIICTKGFTYSILPSVFKHIDKLLSKTSELSEIVFVLAQK